MSQSQSIKSPPITWKALPKYQLKNLKADFKIADFERLANGRHVKKILDAILSNQFYDPVVRVTKEKPYLVIDAQHRLQALYIAHTQHGLKEYDLMLAIYPPEFARFIYRKINMGKRLVAKDHLKALDNGKVAFFTELRPWLSHDPRPDKPQYDSVVQAVYYSKGAKKAASVEDLDTILQQITNKDIEKLKIFCEAVVAHSPYIYGAAVYYAAIFRNIFKISIENNLSKTQIISLINATINSKDIKAVMKDRRWDDLLKVYAMITDKIMPTIK